MARGLLSISLSLALISGFLSFEGSLHSNYAQAVPAAVFPTPVPSALAAGADIVTTMTVTTTISVYVPEPTLAPLPTSSSGSSSFSGTGSNVRPGMIAPASGGAHMVGRDPASGALLTSEDFGSGRVEPSFSSHIYAGPSLNFPNVQQQQQQQQQQPVIHQVQLPHQQVQIPVVVQMPSSVSQQIQQQSQRQQQQYQQQQQEYPAQPQSSSQEGQGIDYTSPTTTGKWVSPRPTVTPIVNVVSPNSKTARGPMPSVTPMAQVMATPPHHHRAAPAPAPASGDHELLSPKTVPVPEPAPAPFQQVPPLTPSSASAPTSENRQSIVCYVDPSSSNTIYCTDGRVYHTNTGGRDTPNNGGVFGSIPVESSSKSMKKKRSTAPPSFSSITSSSADGKMEPWTDSTTASLLGSRGELRFDNPGPDLPLSYQQGQNHSHQQQHKRAQAPPKSMTPPVSSSSSSSSSAEPSWPMYGVGPMSGAPISGSESDAVWDETKGMNDNKYSGRSSYSSGSGSGWKSGSSRGGSYDSGRSYGGGEHGSEYKKRDDLINHESPTNDAHLLEPESIQSSASGEGTDNISNKYSGGGSSYGSDSYGSGSYSGWKSGSGSYSGWKSGSGYGSGHGGGGSGSWGGSYGGGKHGGSGYKKRQLVNPGGPITGTGGGPGSGSVVTVPIDIGLLWDGTNVVPVPAGGSFPAGPGPASITSGDGPGGSDQVIPVPIKIDTLVYPDGHIKVIPSNN
ncbi:hypothetical protein BGZ83_005462 [Gryganskiella cystojenkinii]|nr:hypothetical protein BGZ83_005462 [Gryganskiella cystojenkinii]